MTDSRINSRAKGARFERTLAKKLREYGNLNMTGSLKNIMAANTF